MKLKLIALLAAAFCLASFVAVPKKQAEGSTRPLPCGTFVNDIINLSFGATITQTTVTGGSGGTCFDNTDITSGNQIAINCAGYSVTVRVEGEFESVLMVNHGTGTVYDEVFYDPMGNGSYNVSVYPCFYNVDVIVQ